MDDPKANEATNQMVQPAPGMQTSEMKVLMAASALTAVAGIFHKQMDMDTAVKLVDGMAGLYVLSRSGVKMAHALAAAVMAWAAQQKAPQTRTIVMPPLQPGAPAGPGPATPPRI